MKLPKYLYVLLTAVALFLVIFLGAITRNALQEYNYIGRPGRDTITVNGEGKVSVKPDLAMIELGVTTDGKDVNAIQAENTKKMNAIIDAVKALGVSSDDIQTQNYSVNPRYDWSDGKQTLIGYTINQNVEVKVRNQDKVGDILSKSAELGANQVGGLQFVVDEKQQPEAEARDKAIADAKAKAQKLAADLGLTLVRVVTFSESSYTPTPYPMMYAKAEMAMDSAAPAPAIESGTQDVTSDVSITFEVR